MSPSCSLLPPKIDFILRPIQNSTRTKSDHDTVGKKNALEEKVRTHPLWQAVISAFPKASIENIRTPEQIAAEAIQDALPEVEDEWDPFEEE